MPEKETKSVREVQKNIPAREIGIRRFSLFAEEKLIDEIVVTISPKIFGCGLSLFLQEVSMELELESVDTLGRNLVCLKYRVDK